MKRIHYPWSENIFPVVYPMIPPPIAANIPSLRLAIRQTGPPNTEAMNTAQTIGIGSMWDSSSSSSSSSFFFFFFFFLTPSWPSGWSQLSEERTISRREDRTLAPIRDEEDCLILSGTACAVHLDCLKTSELKLAKINLNELVTFNYLRLLTGDDILLSGGDRRWGEGHEGRRMNVASEDDLGCEVIRMAGVGPGDRRMESMADCLCSLPPHGLVVTEKEELE